MPRALERMAGIQAQYAPAMYLGLWSRVADFHRADLTRALERRSVVQGTLLRATIHLVSAADYWPFAIAVREARRGWWRRVQAQGLTRLTWRRRSSGSGPGWPRPGHAGRARRRRRPAAGARHRPVGGPRPGAAVRDLGAAQGRPLRVRRGLAGPARIEPAAAQEHLVRRYLHGFGPARPADVAGWAGLPARETQAVLDRLALRRFRDEAGQLLVDVPRGPLPAGDTEAPVRFLATWDASLLGHARGKGVLSDELRPAVFSNRNPQSVPTVLVDGAVAAIWRYDGDAVRVVPLRRLHRSEATAVDEEAERLTAFHRDG